MTTELKPIGQIIEENPQQRVFHEKVVAWVQGKGSYVEVVENMPLDGLDLLTRTQILVSKIASKFNVSK